MGRRVIRVRTRGDRVEAEEEFDGDQRAGTGGAEGGGGGEGGP